jgi:hypothetical protein
MTKYGGDVDWDPILPPTNIKIVVDANAETDLIRFVIHELIHITMCGMFVGWVDDQLEEACMLGMEELVYAHVKKSPERERQWRAVLEAKFAEATKGDRLRTVEELTVRPKSDAR